jgi:HSP20 family protein
MLERKERSVLSQGSSSQQGQQPQRRSQFSSPMAQMDRLFDEMFKRPFFSLWSHRLGGEQESEALYVPIDVFEDNESVIVKAEIPGIRKEDINVQLTGDTITISGEKKSESKVQEENFYRMESSYGSFVRSCQLPQGCLSDKARAIFKDGVLEIRIPKSPEAQQRTKQITIE